jgi:CO/xanthine dehydrogenase Mo-binding subunit
MAEKNSKPVNAKFNMLHGIIIRSTIESGKILGVTLPELDNRFHVIGPRDVKGSNIVRILDDTMPLFTASRISYQGQPLLALFGPDAETVEVKAREIEFDFQLPSTDPSIESSSSLRTHSPILYSWGDADQLMKDAAGFVECTYTDNEEKTSEFIVSFVRAIPTDDAITIEVPTQWPHHVRETVSEVCGKPKKKILVVPSPYFSIKDEKLIYPSMLAGIAALATIKSKKPVQIASRFPTYKPKVTIVRKTALDANKKPFAETVTVVVDQGAFPFFSSEMFRHFLAGLIPLYALQAFSVKVNFIASDHPPAHFYGDLGYSSALFSTEAHASALARETQMNPANWRLKYYAEFAERNAMITTPPSAKLRDIIGEIVTQSDFARHSAVYELQRKIKKPLSTFLNYSRGVGIACGVGISGFSSTFSMAQQYSIAITLESNNKVLVNTSFYPSPKVAILWKGLIAKELGLERDNIAFCCTNTSEMIDSGPNVLCQDIERASFMITRCCTAIKSKRFQEPLPITESVFSRSAITNPNVMFSSGSWGVIILELEVNTISLEVEIRQIWCNIAFSQIFDRKLLIGKLRHIIMMSLHECGSVFSYGKNQEPSIKITVTDQAGTTSPGSVDSALRGMILAAYSSALSQALNSEVCSLPVKGDNIIQYVNVR